MSYQYQNKILVVLLLAFVSSCKSSIKAMRNQEAAIDDTGSEAPEDSKSSAASAVGISIATSKKSGEINISIEFAKNAPYKKVDIRRVEGATPPKEDCSSDGIVVKTFTTFDNVVYTDSGLKSSKVYSYRACVYSTDTELVYTSTVANVPAKMLAGDTAGQGAAGGETDLGGETGDDAKSDTGENPANLEFAIVSFNGAVCPSGWSDATNLNGRVVVGSGAGNFDSDNSALTPRALANLGGREYTTGIPAFEGAAIGTMPASNVYPGLSGGRSGKVYGPGPFDTTLGGAKADSNMPPYFVLKYCVKDSTKTMTLANAVVAHKATACLGNWVDFSASHGRVIVGAGSGGLDPDGVSLTPRSLNDVGGREFTTGIPATTATATSAMPGPTLGFSQVVAGVSNFYISTLTETTVAGVKEDANMPPFVALPFCQAPAGAVTSFPSGTVLPFEKEVCPSGWTEYSHAKGRVIVGSGSGNADADNTDLTPRAYGDIGGREYTTGIIASTAAANSITPSPTQWLGVPITARYVGNTSTATTLSGAKEDSNMPPFYTAHYCEKD